MPPKGSGKKGDRGNKKDAREEELVEEQVQELVVTHAPNGNNARPESQNTLVEKLRELQEAQKSITDLSALQKDKYELREREIAAEATYKDSIQLDRDERQRVGFTVRTKAAKREFQEAKKAHEAMKNKLNRESRWRDHDKLVEAQGRLEDFLFYQNSGNRWKRLRTIDPETREAAKAERGARKTSYLLSEKEVAHHKWLHPLLDMYDARGIGTVQYRQGYKNSLGNNIRKLREDPVPPHVGPRDLHLWTPVMRRQPVGLGRDPGAINWRQHQWRLQLDEAAIEARRNEVENDVHEDDSPDTLTHQLRRQNELSLYGTAGRPTTANVRTKSEPSGSVTDDCFSRIRTSNGLFIAAKESSWDWLTSYDCLGPVKSGEIQQVFPVSNVRDNDAWISTPESGDPKDAAETSNTADADSLGVDVPPNERGSSNGDEDQVNNELLPDNSRHEISKSVHKTRETRHTTKKRKAAASTASAEAADKRRKVVEKGKSGGNKTGIRAGANITYPYLRNEFIKATQVPKIAEGPLQVDPWVEETTGRREWHHYGYMSPCSDVDSPPHLPVRPGGIDDGDIPEGFALTNTKPFPLEPGSRQKCKLNPERCRVWWNPDHPAEECWIPYPEEPTRPQDPIEWPLLAIDAPKDNPDDYLPSQERDIYRSRLYDHYGLMHNRGSENRESQWPRFGVRIPYEPMTFDDLRLKIQSNDEAPAEVGNVVEDLDGPTTNIIAKDAKLRTAQEIRAMAVPIIERSQRAWGRFPTEPPGGDGGGSGEEESDDEGDLFTISYTQSTGAANNPPASHDAN